MKNIGGSGGPSITMVPKAGSSGTVSASQVTIISKPAVATPKPTIRINTGQGGLLFSFVVCALCDSGLDNLQCLWDDELAALSSSLSLNWALSGINPMLVIRSGFFWSLKLFESYGEMIHHFQGLESLLKYQSFNWGLSKFVNLELTTLRITS